MKKSKENMEFLGTVLFCGCWCLNMAFHLLYKLIKLLVHFLQVSPWQGQGIDWSPDCRGSEMTTGALSLGNFLRKFRKYIKVHESGPLYVGGARIWDFFGNFRSSLRSRRSTTFSSATTDKKSASRATKVEKKMLRPEEMSAARKQCQKQRTFF